MKNLSVPAKFAFAMILTTAAVSGCKKQEADPAAPELRSGATPDAGVITPPAPGNQMPAPEAPAPAPSAISEPATTSGK
jgi:hypothetical protein